MSFSLHSSTENFGGGRRSGSVGSNSSSRLSWPVKSSIGLMSLNVSASPRSRNHLKESRWMATRSGSGSASSMLANEKRSGLLDRVGNGLLLPVARRMGQGRGTAVDQVSKRHGGARTAGSTTAAGAVVRGVRARDTQRKRLRKATGAGTATSKHNRKRTRSQPPGETRSQAPHKVREPGASVKDSDDRRPG